MGEGAVTLLFSCFCGESRLKCRRGDQDFQFTPGDSKRQSSEALEMAQDRGGPWGSCVHDFLTLSPSNAKFCLLNSQHTESSLYSESPLLGILEHPDSRSYSCRCAMGFSDGPDRARVVPSCDLENTSQGLRNKIVEARTTWMRNQRENSKGSILACRRS